MKKYESFVRRYREQPNSEAFAFLRFDSSQGQTWETPYEQLAEMAKDEPWNFRRTEFIRNGQSYPILTNYLNYTFLRLQELNQIAYSSDGLRACFNTGLQTDEEKDIYATFYRNKWAEEREQSDWILIGFFDSYSEQLGAYRPLPDIARYIDNASDLVFDVGYEIEINHGHIVDTNSERLPESLRNSPTLAIAAMEGATKFLKEKVTRNYKTAIPQWWRRRIQLLLPLNLTNPNYADLALVADKDPVAKLYRIRTGLPMDVALINARLITRPDDDWLNP